MPSPASVTSDGAIPSLLQRPGARRALLSVLVLAGGLLLGLCFPRQGGALLGLQRGLWALAYVPLFLAVPWMLLHAPAGRWARAWRVFLCTWPAGVLVGLVTGDWVINTATVYGHLPAPVAVLVTALGYGSLIGLELFAYLGLPLWIAHGRPWLLLGLVPLWSMVGQIYVPRFLYWTFGQALHAFQALPQVADLLGSAGLNLLVLPVNLLLAAWLVRGLASRAAPWLDARLAHLPRRLPLRPLALASAGALLLLGAAQGYGHWRLGRLASEPPVNGSVRVLGVQPDFSLGNLASNPALSHSERQGSLRALLSDGHQALFAAPPVADLPTVVVWPESVYPRPYLQWPNERAFTESWVQRWGVHLVVTTLDIQQQRGPDGPERKVYGAAVHVAPDGTPAEVYHKLSLIPFGETIPLSGVIPGYRDLLKWWIPQISEFDRGERAVVFPIAPGVVLAPMICFDATVQQVARAMTEEGATLGLVLANLAWFGQTSIGEQFGLYVRFRAIENRLPILLLSQNGPSHLYGRSGAIRGPRLGLFENGVWDETLALRPAGSFFSRHADAVQGGYALLLLALLAWRWGPGLRAWVRRRRGAA